MEWSEFDEMNLRWLRCKNEKQPVAESQKDVCRYKYNQVDKTSLAQPHTGFLSYSMKNLLLDSILSPSLQILSTEIYMSLYCYLVFALNIKDTFRVSTGPDVLL